MIRKLHAIAPMTVDWIDMELGPVQSHQIRVVSEYSAAKHGTELAFVSGKAQLRGPYNQEWQLHDLDKKGQSPFPFSVGNCVVGKIVEVGHEVKGFQKGQRVLVEEVPFQTEHVVDIHKVWPIPDHVDWRSAVCLDPSLFALGAIRDGNVRVGDSVAIFGLGAIGLMAIQLAKLAGASPIIGIDPIENRRKIALKLGANYVLDPLSVDSGKEIKRLTNKKGVDVILEISGNVHAMQSALRGIAWGGNVVAVAFPSPYPAGLDLGAEAHLNRPNLIFSRACSDPNREHPRWDFYRIRKTCWDLICQGQLRGEDVVSPIIPFTDLKEQYVKILTDSAHSIKLGVVHS